ncbi:MAG: hypothetical protein R2854_08930 [Caldilineaceae bacterium]
MKRSFSASDRVARRVHGNTAPTLGLTMKPASVRRTMSRLLGSGSTPSVWATAATPSMLAYARAGDVGQVRFQLAHEAARTGTHAQQHDGVARAHAPTGGA